MRDTVSLRQMTANIIALLSGMSLARGLAAIASVIIARQIGPEAFGQYSATLALMGLTTILFSLGLDSWLLYQGGKDRENLTLHFTSALSIKVLLGVVWLAGFWLVAPYLNQSSFPWLLIALGSFALWLEELAKIAWNAFTACLRNNLTLILMIIAQGSFLVITLWLASQQAQEPESYMGGRLMAALLGAVVSSILVARKIGLHLQLETLWPTIRGTLPFAASIAFGMIYGRADLTIVASALGEGAAGLYAPALTVTNTLFLVPAAIFAVVVPILSRGHMKDRSMWIKRASIWLTLGLALIGIMAGLGLAWISDPLIDLLYGAAYQESGALLVILGGVLVLRYPSTALAAVLVAVGWQTWRVGVQAVSAVLNIGLNLLIVHQFGVMGVAKVYVFTEAVLLLGYLGTLVVWMRKRPTSL